VKKRTRIVRNHPAFDRQNVRWVRVLSIYGPDTLEVKSLNAIYTSPYLVKADQVDLWHPEEGLNEASGSALAMIPVGSKITVGNSEYTRLFRGWLEQEYDDLAEYEYSRFIPDPGVEAKASSLWALDCNNHSGTPYLLEADA
jgi:hypothetical protein